MTYILLIEDEPSVRQDVATMLRTIGHEVVEARDGREGLRLLKTRRPEIILTDILMPTTDGIEVIAANRGSTSPAKVIAMAGQPGLGDIDYLVVARALGADDTLRKPFRTSELRAAIARCLGYVDHHLLVAQLRRGALAAGDSQSNDEQRLLASGVGR